MELYTNQIVSLIDQLDADQILLEYAGNTFKTGDLLVQSQTLAIHLSNQGMKEKDRVVIAAEPGIDFVKIMFATMMIGAEVAIIDPEMGRENYKNKLNQFKPGWVFLDARIQMLQQSPLLRRLYFWWRKNGLYFPPNPDIKKILTGPKIPFQSKYLRLDQFNVEHFDSTIGLVSRNGDPGYLITYTSGTTDEPKGVFHSVNGLGNSILQVAEILKSDQPQTLATHLPHFMLIGACAGISIRLWKSTDDAKKRITFIRKYKITTLFGPPAEYLLLMNYCGKSGIKLPDSLTHVILGSAPVHKSFLERLVKFLPAKTKITCIYGMTENLVACTIDGRAKIKYVSQGDPLGKPIPNVKIKINDDHEILIKSPQLFLRYFHKANRPDWHATGDLGYLDTNGHLILTGRKKQMIIRRNFNLYPALYEPTIKKIQNIDEAVLVGRYSEELADEEVFLIVESEKRINLIQLRKQLESGPFSIAKEAWPDHILQKEIPRKGRQQKIDRIALLASL